MESFEIACIAFEISSTRHLREASTNWTSHGISFGRYCQRMASGPSGSISMPGTRQMMPGIATAFTSRVIARGGEFIGFDNFRRLRGWGWKGFPGMRLWRQDKGQDACVAAFIDAVREGKPSPIPLDEIFEVSRVSIEVQEALS